MRDFAIFTHVPHKIYNGKIYAYGPYVWEMNLWLHYFQASVVVAPIRHEPPSKDELAYDKKIDIIRIPEFDLRSITNVFLALVKVPVCIFHCFVVMFQARHLHIRCPGNVGLLALISQLFYPRKPKSIKYAGCWPSYHNEPRSYKLQKFLIANQTLTRNAKGLIYGDWQPKNANLVPSFTASYNLPEDSEHSVQFSKPFQILFVGRFNQNKGCLLVVEAFLELLKKRGPFQLKMIGDGPLMNAVQEKTQGIVEVEILGKLDRESVKKHYQNSHFLIAPSETEGWPKIVAEAMFWGVIPLVTDISCVKEMLGSGKRGVIIPRNPQEICMALDQLSQDRERLQEMSQNGKAWSRQFTLDSFKAFIGGICDKN